MARPDRDPDRPRLRNDRALPSDLLSGGAAPEEGEEVPEALQEAESELGINEWIDPDTGGPAEDNVPRIEDH